MLNYKDITIKTIIKQKLYGKKKLYIHSVKTFHFKNKRHNSAWFTWKKREIIWDVQDYCCHAESNVFQLILLQPNHLVHKTNYNQEVSYRFNYIQGEIFSQCKHRYLLNFRCKATFFGGYPWKCHSLRNQQLRKQWAL